MLKHKCKNFETYNIDVIEGRINDFLSEKPGRYVISSTMVRTSSTGKYNVLLFYAQEDDE